MTILLRTTRPSFAVLAADRWVAYPDRPRGERQKVITHSKLPLAFGAAGSAWWVFPTPRQEDYIDTFLRQLAGEITSVDELNLPSIAKRVCDRLLPGYAEMKRTVAVAVALVKDGKAAVGLQRIGTPTDFIEGHQMEQVNPRGYCTLEELASLHDPSVTCPTEVSRRGRELVERAIAMDEKQPELQRIIGYPVDLVLVTDRAQLSTFTK
jgi:hypothetical protein